LYYDFNTVNTKEASRSIGKAPADPMEVYCGSEGLPQIQILKCFVGSSDRRHYSGVLS
jgi:hypothetical protein